MGNCGCKGTTKQEKIVPTGITPLVIQQVEIPVEYTKEDIIKLKDYVSSTNKTESQRMEAEIILKKHFGDIIPSYCNQPCLKFIQGRINTMELKLK